MLNAQNLLKQPEITHEMKYGPNYSPYFKGKHEQLHLKYLSKGNIFRDWIINPEQGYLNRNRWEQSRLEWSPWFFL